MGTAVIDLLVQQHLTFADAFARHQEALLERRWVEAARLLASYGDKLRQHIDLEERYLLSQWAEACGAGHWPAEVYRAEHRRIEQLLGKAEERLRRARAGVITPAVLISLLDEERTLKRLIEHHHEREEKALFAHLRDHPPAGIGAGMATEASAPAQ